MKLDRIRLLNFRNYVEMQNEFNPDLNIILGRNGNGKTNILEAIYFMSIGKSFRTSRDREAINFGAENGYISSVFEKNGKLFNMEMLIGKSNKAIKINGISVQKISELFGLFNCVIFSPEDIRMLKDGPSERRRFLDREISQIMPVYYHSLSAYGKLLAQRNNHLKSRCIDETLIEIYDIQMCEYAAKIYRLRKLFIENMAQVAKKIYSRIAGTDELFEIEYLNQLNIGNESLCESEAASKLKSLLQRSRSDDIQRGNTKYGPHRDDMKVCVNSTDVRTYGSQGQQRTAAISLKLSQIELVKNETGEYPVLLLDDVLSELDEKRQKSLIGSICGIQTFVTTAEDSHLNIFEGCNMSVFRVSQGKIICTPEG